MMNIESLDLVAPLTLDAAARVPTFDMLAYSGGVMQPALGGQAVIAVVDLAGLRVPTQTAPLLLDHESDRPVGHTESIVNDGRTLRARGTVSQANEHSASVLTAARNRFPWQSSISVSVLESYAVPAGRPVQVNGRTLTGPFLLVSKSELREISVVALGGDANATLNIAAKAAGKAILMDPITSQATAQAAAADTAAATSSPNLTTAATAQQSPTVAAPAAGATLNASQGDPMALFREQRAAEMDRMHGITQLCGDQHHTIAAQAIRENWTLERAENAVLKASRPQGPSVHVRGSADLTPEIMTAGLCMVGNLNGLEKAFTPQTLDAADKAFKGGANVSLQRLLLTAARQNGYHGDHFDKSPTGMLDILRAAFSTRSGVAGIFTNTANKFLLEGYNFVEQVWRKIAAIRTVTDFKQVTSYRLTDALTYEELGPTGEIKHGELGEQSFTNQARTYAKMLSIPRTDIINDDLSALTTIPKRLGRGGGLTLNKIFWKKLQDDAAFFSDSNTPDNLAAAALGIAGLTTVKTQFESFTDPQGEILDINPALLLVPGALEMLARQLMSTTTLVGGNSTVLNSNTFAGKYEVVASKYLNNAPTSWYLTADPNDVPIIEICFLNGVQTPTVETADVDFNQLGIQMRGFHDFGVGLQDPRGAVKSVG